MPSNPPPKRSWRGDDDVSNRQAARPWQRGADAGPKKPFLSRRGKIVLASGLFVSLIVAIVFVLYWPTSVAAQFVLMGAENDVYGQNGLNEVEAWAKANPDKIGGGSNGSALTRINLDDGGDPFSEFVKNFLGFRKSPETVIIFLAGHGTVDGEGHAVLLRRAADPKDPLAGAYKVRSVLESLQKLPDKTKKLLIIDATQVPSDWDLGMLNNDFARALADEDLIKNNGVKNLVVLSASDEDQQSWVAEEYRRTIFAHYVLQGLQGADEANNNGMVTGESLASYVKKNVEKWVRHNRSALQEPVLIDKSNIAGSMKLVRVEGKPSVPDAAPYVEKAELREAWQQHAELCLHQKPWTYAPQLWRQYQDLLLRYEYLIRAGADGKAVRDRLDKLRQGLLDNQSRMGESIGNSLAVRAAVGAPPPAKNGEIESQFDKVWDRPNASPEDVAREIDRRLKPPKPNGEGAWRGSNESRDDKLARLRVVDLVVQRASQSLADFDRAAIVLEKLDRASDPLPIEAQIVRQLHRRMESDGSPDQQAIRWSLTERAIRLEVRAEEAALGLDSANPRNRELPAYSDEVRPWIRDRIETADVKRRSALDLLFGSANDRWAADPLLKEADQGYRDAQKRALEVRDALELRDRALAEYPYLARWRSRQMFEDLDDQTAGEGVKEKERLWSAVYKLCDALNPAQQGWKDPGPLNSLTDPVRELLREEGKPSAQVQVRTYREELRSFGGERDKLPGATPRNWHKLDDLLSVPLPIPQNEQEKQELVEQRMHALKGLRDVSRKLNEATDTATPSQNFTKKENGKFALSAAQRQGRLAVALLGKRGESIKSSVDDPRANEWWISMRAAGGRIRDELRGMAKDAADKAEEGRKAVPVDEADRKAQDENLAALSQADLNARLLSGPADAAWFDKVDPPLEYRNLLLHNLFIGEARRTRLDYWAAAVRDAKSFYKVAGERYATDAGNFLANESGRRDAIANKVKNDLGGSDRLALRWKKFRTIPGGVEPIYVTDDLTHMTEKRGYRTIAVVGLNQNGDATAPADPSKAGRAVVWVGDDSDETDRKIGVARTGEGFGTGGVADPRGERYLQGPFSGGIPETTLEVRPEWPKELLSRSDDRRLTVKGFYRGRDLEESPTVVRVHYQPDTSIYQTEPPRYATLAVQAETDIFNKYTIGNSHIVFILDCSGSMKLPLGNPKMKQAKEALATALANLPDGVTVTVMTYAQEVPGAGEERYNWVHILVDGIVWNSKEAVQQQAQLRKQLEGLNAEGRTPLVGSMWFARERLRKFPGIKTLIVITDGADTCFEDRLKIDLRKGNESILPPGFKQLGRPGQTLDEFMVDTFGKVGPGEKPEINLTVIGFDVDVPANEQKSYDAFIKGLKAIGAGNIIEAKNRDQLLAVLEKTALQRLQFQLEKKSGSFKSGKEILEDCDVSRFDRKDPSKSENPRWLPEDLAKRGGTFEIRVQTNRQLQANVTQMLTTSPGDYLLLELLAIDNPGPTEGRFRFQRASYLNRVNRLLYPRSRDDLDKPGWHLGVLQNEGTGAKLQMTVSLEKMLDQPSSKASIRLVRPSQVWFNVTPQTSGGPRPRLEVYPLYDYPAPVYGIDLDDWPRKAPPTLDVRWTDEDERLLKHAVNSKDANGNGDYKDILTDLRGFPVRTKVLGRDVEVVIESVTIETRRVLVGHDSKNRIYAEKDCLVVRLSYPEGTKPFYVALPESAEVAGAEHHFYVEAGRYTGVFWDFNAEKARALTSLGIVSVEEFREAQTGVHKEKVTLPEPDDKKRPPRVEKQKP